MTVAALVLGAGSGDRLRAGWSTGEAPAGSVPPKAFVELAGKSLLARSIDALCASGAIDWVVPVLPAAYLGEWPALAKELADAARVRAPVAGGATRQASARAGLAALGPEVRWIAVHDAARPLVRPRDVARVVEAARASGAALLAAPVRDTIHRVLDGAVAATPPRRELWAAQTPQVFRADWLGRALELDASDATDDAELVARLGLRVAVVASDERNLKITTRQDLALAERWLAEAAE